MADGKKIGIITHFFPHIPAGIIKLEAELKVGDRIKIVGATSEFEQEVAEMQIDRKSIESARAGMEVSIKVDQKVHEGNQVFLM